MVSAKDTKNENGNLNWNNKKFEKIKIIENEIPETWHGSGATFQFLEILNFENLANGAINAPANDNENKGKNEKEKEKEKSVLVQRSPMAAIAPCSGCFV